MYPEDKLHLTKQELRQIHDSLLQGVVSRASFMSFMFAIAFSVYSFTSHQFLIQFVPDLTLFENTWPRLLFNGLPLALLGLYFRRHSENYRLKSVIWALGLPAIFFAASMIHVWPLMWTGESRVYLYVHSANAFVFTTALIIVSPPPRILMLQVGSFVILGILPLIGLLAQTGDSLLLNHFFNEWVLAFGAIVYIAHSIHKLRNRIAIMDFQIRKDASPFLGPVLAEAIYDRRSHKLDGKVKQAIVMFMDIRGFTRFHQSTSPDIARPFMNAYHAMVSHYTSEFGGHWHKSVGDAQMCSFGAISGEEDLSDVPGIEDDLMNARMRKHAERFENAISATFSIAFEFERLKAKFDIEAPLSLGIALDFGDVEVRVQGDGIHRKELDIAGDVVIRAARLEAYTKVIRKRVAPESSILILSPELKDVADHERVFKPWLIESMDLRVPDFPNLGCLYYHVFLNENERRLPLRNRRAS